MNASEHGWPLEIVDEIGSTSDALIERAGSGESGPAALLARHQTRGRGRRGRTWEGPSGNLAMSVLLRPRCAPDEIGRMVLLAGLAMRDALQRHAGNETRLELKWPNDVLLMGDKLGGVLVESALDGAGWIDWLVIGFGANLAHAPLLAGRRTASLARVCRAPEAETVGWDVLTGLDRWMGVLARDGFDAIREAWQHHAQPVGTDLVVDGRAGRYAGLTVAGHLLLDVGARVEVVSAGDVTLAGA